MSCGVRRRGGKGGGGGAASCPRVFVGIQRRESISQRIRTVYTGHWQDWRKLKGYKML